MPMAGAEKHLSINGGTLILDLTRLLSLRTKRKRTFAYGFVFAFVLFTVFLAFNPSSNPSFPWFSNVFTISTVTGSTGTSRRSTTPTASDGPFRSHVSSIYSYFFPTNSPQSVLNSTSFSSSSPTPQSPTFRSRNSAFNPVSVNETPPSVKNQTHNKDLRTGPSKSQLIANQTVYSASSEGKNATLTMGSPKSPPSSSPSTNSATNSSTIGDKNASGYFGKNTVEKGGAARNFTSSLARKQSNGMNSKQGIEDLMKPLLNCNLFDGVWVKDESYPLYKPGSCFLIDEQFNCVSNGRPDNEFQKLKWKPKGCSLPRLDGAKMLDLLRGKRLVFVGDSLNRNMWESLVCILRNSAKDKRKVFEASGRQHFRSEDSYSFVFKDYNCTVEFFVSPFLVREWEAKDKNGTKETLRLDLLESSADRYKTADIVIFNTGHWWTHDKTAKGKDYYQEGSHVYSDLNVLEAFRKAMTTWGRWVDANINPNRTLVFFRGYSATHFSGGQWNSGGQCDHETEPIKNDTYLNPYPPKMAVLERVLKGMKTRVVYLNVTRLTDYRKDGHPSIHRRHNTAEEEKIRPLQYQDCSHWCLPGVPDSWNELLYAELLAKQYLKQPVGT